MTTNATYSCIIADDNKIDRLTTVAHAKKYSFLSIVGVYDNSAAVLEAAKELKPQVLLLDIDMGETSGLQLRKMLQEVDACIFITSYPDYAIESFDVDALDFLVKPFKSERFDLSMNRLYQYLESKYKATMYDYIVETDAVFIKVGYDNVKIRMHEVLYLEGLKDYTAIVTATKKYCVLSSIGNFLNNPAFSNFIRVHKSYAVQKRFIEKVSATEVFMKNGKVPLGRTFIESVREQIE